MSLKKPIDHIKIEGFKSIQSLDLKLTDLNVLIGSNGSGKSNFVTYFRLLSHLIAGSLAFWVNSQGGANRLLTYGTQVTDRLSSTLYFDKNSYQFELAATVDDRLIFQKEILYFQGDGHPNPFSIDLGRGHSEANLKSKVDSERIADYCYSAISKWRIYHFHDTSDTARVKQQGVLHDNRYLRSNASNLAAFLYKLKEEYSDTYTLIVDTIRLAIPF